MSSLGASSSSSGMFGAHRDVLDAKPDSEAAVMSLLEELKRRGRAAVGSRAYPDAQALYSKAIEIYPTSTSSPRDKAILYSNRSLCELQMNQLEKARDDAEMATVIDPTYVKGFWRLGSAHAARSKETALALKAYQNALTLEPTNSALQKEVRKMETRLQKEVEEEKNKPKEEASPAPPPPPKKTTTPVVKKTSSNSNQEKSNDTVMADNDDENIFTASDKIRGYKIVGGKKTSYFHHEQTEEEKRLIGDIAPKRIETSTMAQNNDSEEKKTDTSAWNKAGTWEERDVTAWAVKTLTESLMNCQYQLPAEIMSNSSGEGLAKVTKVTKLKSHTDGGTAHASYASVRGKKRYIYEFCIGLNWELTLPGDDKASGTMSFPDVDGTCELGDGYDLVEFTVNRDESTASTQPLVEKFVRHGGLRNIIHDTIDDWVRTFRNTY